MGVGLGIGDWGLGTWVWREAEWNGEMKGGCESDGVSCLIFDNHPFSVTIGSFIMNRGIFDYIPFIVHLTCQMALDSWETGSVCSWSPWVPGSSKQIPSNKPSSVLECGEQFDTRRYPFVPVRTQCCPQPALVIAALLRPRPKPNCIKVLVLYLINSIRATPEFRFPFQAHAQATAET